MKSGKECLKDKKRKRKSKWEKRKSERRLRERMKSGVAQWKRGRPITCRSVDRNFPPLFFQVVRSQVKGKGVERERRERREERRKSREEKSSIRNRSPMWCSR